MSVQEHTAVAQKAGAVPRARPRATASDDWMQGAVAQSVLSSLPQGDTRFVARAPGGLEIVGGLSDYAGSAAVIQTVADFAYAAVQARADERLSIVFPHDDGRSPVSLPWSKLIRSDGRPVAGAEGCDLIEGTDLGMVRCVLGAVAELLRTGTHRGRCTGLTIAAAYTDSPAEGCAKETSLIAATLVAIATALDIRLDPFEAAVICQRVENDWLGDAVGIGHALSVMVSPAAMLGLVQCDPHREIGQLRLPDGLALLPIACHAAQPDFRTKYDQVRTASFMGRLLADRIARHDRPKDLEWDGHLSRISAEAYVEHFRDRIPTKFKGEDFLNHFGETGDPLTRIDPKMFYKVRSRTEHHIYEHVRASQFFGCLGRASRDGGERTLKEAGGLMYASHWSYGQRCGLGCIETDFMVNAIRRQKEPDIFGAKLTGRGGGGIVAVLMRSTDRAFAAVEQAARQYTNKTKKPVTIYRDSVPGAYVTGAVRV